MVLSALALVAGGLTIYAASAAAPAPAPAGGDGVTLEGMPAGLLAPRELIATEDVPASVVRSGKSVQLAIADRPSDTACPPEGWCGESAIQQALLYYGAYVPQKAINAAGRPAHPDLYSEDIPRAVKALGMGAAPCVKESRDYAAYSAWLREQIDAGRPVVIGMKINPTKHPEWGVDHFLLAVGHSDDSLIFNTTWKEQRTVTFKDLGTTKPDLSFKNSYNSYYGVAVTGPEGLGDGFAAVRLFVRKEDAKEVTLAVKCEGLSAGARYVVYRLSAADQKTARPLAVFEAKGGPVFAFVDTASPADTAIYRCRKVN
jgi:hypothetical protein